MCPLRQIFQRQALLPQWAPPLLCPPLLQVGLFPSLRQSPYSRGCASGGGDGRGSVRCHGKGSEAESRARLELESQMGALNLQCEQLDFQREQMALPEKRALEEKRAAEEASATAVRRYRESKAYPVDVRAYIPDHAEESYGVLKATRAGKRCVTRECAHMHDLGEYDMQQAIYSSLRRRDVTFDPEAWGLPLELMDLEPRAEPTTSHSESGTEVVTGDDPFPGLTLGLSGAVDTQLDQIHIPPDMADFDQAADPEFCTVENNVPSACVFARSTRPCARTTLGPGGAPGRAWPRPRRSSR
nr:tubby-related protein 1-like isoform X1 [Ipomoea batatas]